RRTQVEIFLKELACGLLTISTENLDWNAPLIRFGLDSIQAMEFKSRIESDLGVALPVDCLLGGVSLAEIAKRVFDDPYASRGGDNHSTRIASSTETVVSPERKDDAVVMGNGRSRKKVPGKRNGDVQVPVSFQQREHWLLHQQQSDQSKA